MYMTCAGTECRKCHVERHTHSGNGDHWVFMDEVKGDCLTFLMASAGLHGTVTNVGVAFYYGHASAWQISRGLRHYNKPGLKAD